MRQHVHLFSTCCHWLPASTKEQLSWVESSHEDVPRYHFYTNVNKPRACKNLMHVILAESVVRDGQASWMIVSVDAMGNEVDDQKDAAGFESLTQTPGRLLHVLEVVESKPHDNEVEVTEVRARYGLARFIGTKQVADHSMSVDPLGLGLRCESLVVRLDHIITDVDASKFAGIACQDMGHGSGPAGIVQHSDFLRTGSWSC